MAWLIVAGAPITALSYLNTPREAPLHLFWGAEAFVLTAVGIAGIVAAITARSRWRFRVRILLGATMPLLVLGTLAAGYWPHGPLVVLGAEAIAVILAAPKAAFEASGRSQPSSRVVMPNTWS